MRKRSSRRRMRMNRVEAFIMMNTFDIVIGLEVHAQVKTNTKLFCSCAVEFGERQNTNVCPVCTGQPGALPVINRASVTQAIKAALITHSRINPKNVFARKSYFYPDLPKGYQISQFELPFCEKGHVDIELKDGSTKRIGLTRIHMEDDAGKNVHQGAEGILGSHSSLVDLNRAGTTLLEIVTEPEMTSIEEARVFLDTLKLLLQYADVSDADMEKGQLRVDVNVSLKPAGSATLGTRAEVKNMNSFRGIEKAIKYEIDRQTEILEAGGQVAQETRNYDDATETTSTLRSKEEAHDYRYFPDPDLLPLQVSEDWIAEVKTTLPELPADRKQRYLTDHLSPYDAQGLVNNKPMADFFDATVNGGADPKMACNWLTSDIAGILKEKKQSLAETPLTPALLSKMIQLIQKGTISTKIAKTILLEMIENGTDPEKAVEKSGMTQITSAEELAPIIASIIAANPKQVEQYKAGQEKLFGFFVGQTMKATSGRAQPELLNQLLKATLG